MWDKFEKLVDENLLKVLTVPTLISGFTFLSNIIQSLSDGHISQNELQGIISSASGLETLGLLVIMIVLKFKK